MAVDGADAADSPITREEWRALRRIRRLHLIRLWSWVTFYLWLASFLPLLQLELVPHKPITWQTAKFQLELTLVGVMIVTAASACEGIVGVVLEHSRCPRCRHEFFDPHRSRRRAPADESEIEIEAPRIANSERAQRCRNCGLSLGLAALREPPAPPASRA
jgi:hypothetical protein